MKVLKAPGGGTGATPAKAGGVKTFVEARSPVDLGGGRGVKTFEEVRSPEAVEKGVRTFEEVRSPEAIEKGVKVSSEPGGGTTKEEEWRPGVRVGGGRQDTGRLMFGDYDPEGAGEEDAQDSKDHSVISGVDEDSGSVHVEEGEAPPLAAAFTWAPYGSGAEPPPSASLAPSAPRRPYLAVLAEVDAHNKEARRQRKLVEWYEYLYEGGAEGYVSSLDPPDLESFSSGLKTAKVALTTASLDLKILCLWRFRALNFFNAVSAWSGAKAVAAKAKVWSHVDADRHGDVVGFEAAVADAVGDYAACWFGGEARLSALLSQLQSLTSSISSISRGGMTKGEKEYVLEKVARWDDARERFVDVCQGHEVYEWVVAGGL